MFQIIWITRLVIAHLGTSFIYRFGLKKQRNKQANTQTHAEEREKDTPSYLKRHIGPTHLHLLRYGEERKDLSNNYNLAFVNIPEKNHFSTFKILSIFFSLYD